MSFMELIEASKIGNVGVVQLALEGGADPNQTNENNVTALHMACGNGHDEVVRVLLAAKATVNTQSKSGESPLLAASFKGHLKCVELLIDAGTNVDTQREDNWTVLHAASNNGHDEVVRVLLAAKATVNMQSKSGETPLWSASFEGHLKCVELLIDAGANVDMQEEDGTTALFVAAQNGHLRVVEVLIAAKAQVDIQQKDNVTALYMACRNGHDEVVRVLLAAKATVNMQSKDGTTALFVAAQNGHLRVVEVLIAAKAQVDIQQKSGQSPLWSASFNGHLKCVELLIDAGANVDMQEEDGTTALFVAAQNGHLRVVEVLIAAKAQVDIQWKDNVTALYMACRNGHDEVVRVLLAAKATVNMQSKSGETPLWSASFEGHLKCVELLIDAGANVDMQKEDGTTALFVAAQNGHLRVVEVLIAAKAQVDIQQKSGQSPLWSASFDGHLKCVELLIDAGANVDMQEEDGTTALFVAAQNGHLRVVEVLIAAKAQVDIQQKNNMTALHIACWNGHDEVVTVLLAAKATVNSQTKLGESPLLAASFKGHLKCVELLIDAGANVDMQEEDGTTALFVAAQNGHLRVVEVLIAAKAQVDIQQKDGSTALHLACDEGHCEVVECLVKKGHCHINARDGIGLTPLHSACYNGHKEVVEYLVETANCDTSATDAGGSTPLDYAIQKGHTETIEYLQSLGAPSAAPIQSTVYQSPPVEQQPQGLLNKLQTPAIQLSERAPLTQDEIDALQKLIEGTEVNIDTFIATGQGITLEEAHQLLAQKGYIEDARNLKTRLKEIAEEQQRYLEILKDLMTASDAINLRYLKLFLVGPPFVGKTTTLNRLLKIFENIHSAGDKVKLQSTLLANCIQAFAFVGDDTAEWLSSSDLDNETKLLFNYFCGNKLTSGEPLDTPLREQLSEEHTTPPEPARTQSHVQQNEPHTHNSVENIISQVDKLQTSDGKKEACKNQRINDVVNRFQKLIKSGGYSSHLFSSLGTFLNINDIGGQPGFLEMLPALSTGPAMYLVFLDLSKELNKPYKIPFSRDDTIITPYDAIHTVKDTVSQILSSISSIHSNPQVTSSFKTDKVDGFSEKLKLFLKVSPLAALIGTHKDKLNDPEKEIKKTSEHLNDIVKKFEEIIICPEATGSSNSLFTVDNYNGTEHSDIAPLRKLLSEIFHKRFKNASLPIRPKWLLFGLILRREYKIASIEDCLELGKKLEMDENETKFCLRYLHDCIGTVMHYTSVSNDKEKWLKNRVICSPQVIFDSISQLIVPSLRVLHSGSTFTEYERKELIRMGQYSAEAIEMYCKTAQVSKKLGNNELIPAKVLITLLQHLNLLSEIVHIDVNDPSNSRSTYLMPAILECASQDELTNPPPPDANNPEPLLITFSCGYVPTGAFCGLITRLVSRGPHGILGLTWELVEDGVKRNYVSFLVAKSNRLTLLAHDQCYEIRVVRHPGRMSLHDLCTYVLSVMLYTLKSLYPHLVPQIAFQCPCPGHKSSRDNLCVLTKEIWVQFLCDSKPTIPTKYQQVWLGKIASIGQSASLGVLQFMKEQSLEKFSFNWSKVGRTQPPITHHCKTNNLTFQSVSEEDLDYYQCEVKEAGKVVLTVYRALYKDAFTSVVSETLIRECLGVAGQKRELSDGETSDAKRTQLISPPGSYAQPVGTTRQQLMDEYQLSTTHINREIQQEDVPFLALYFDNVEFYVDAMKLTPGEQSDVQLKRIESNHLAMIKCLKIWRGKQRSQATFRALLEMLVLLKKEKIADQVCQYLKDCLHAQEL
ncbi:uncharacterized protein LOC135339631 isoform X4 [Halichondria panicea]|uniref:uncharacterized protein LOC135339631 isoform X4 n=1 Tax=Halichondria panicea TaxID=6063 RepID=UPI00312BC606